MTEQNTKLPLSMTQNKKNILERRIAGTCVAAGDGEWHVAAGDGEWHVAAGDGEWHGADLREANLRGADLYRDPPHDESGADRRSRD